MSESRHRLTLVHDFPNISTHETVMVHAIPSLIEFVAVIKYIVKLVASDLRALWALFAYWHGDWGLV